MEIKNENYSYYLKHQINSIPDVELYSVIKELAINATFIMGDKQNGEELAETIKAVNYIIKNYYPYLPLYLVAEGFGRGAIGELGGTTKFTARNVNIWLSQMKEKSQNLTTLEHSREDAERRKQEEKIFKSKQQANVMFGTALSLKLSWVYTGRMSIDNWDNISLDDIVLWFRKGYRPDEISPSLIKNF